jgi:hypothetical protein
VPLYHQQLDRLSGDAFDSHIGDLTYLNRGLCDALCSASVGRPLVYLETAYHGGMGQQGAAAFRDGRLVWHGADKDITSAHPGPHSHISKALQLIDVPGPDAFAELGLGRFRDVEDLGLSSWDDD